MNITDSVTIRRERPDTKTAARLVAELDAYLAPLYPQESQHGYSIEKLVRQQVEFYVLYHGGEPAGCGGVQFRHDPHDPASPYGELKRMYVRDKFRGRGLGRMLLAYLEKLALDRGVTTMRLETGTRQPEAVALYETAGYYRIPPFGDYWDDPVSLCYEKRLEASDSKRRAG